LERGANSRLQLAENGPSAVRAALACVGSRRIDTWFFRASAAPLVVVQTSAASAARSRCGKRQYKRERPIRADYVHSPERKPS